MPDTLVEISDTGAGIPEAVLEKVRAAGEQDKLPSAPAEKTQRLPRLRILVVDDEESIRTVLQRMLSDDDIMLASSGRRCDLRARESGLRHHLVRSDHAGAHGDGRL